MFGPRAIWRDRRVPANSHIHGGNAARLMNDLGGHDEALAAVQEAVHLCRDAATTPRPNTLTPALGAGTVDPTGEVLYLGSAGSPPASSVG